MKKALFILLVFSLLSTSCSVVQWDDEEDRMKEHEFVGKWKNSLYEGLGIVSEWNLTFKSDYTGVISYEWRMSGGLISRSEFKFSWIVEGDKISYNGIEGQSTFPWYTFFLSDLKGVVVHNGVLYYLLENNGDISIRPEQEGGGSWSFSKK